MLSIIVAVAKNNVIGKDNKLIWHLPEDLKRFKRITTNKNIIMGRKTFESLGKVLPNRKHIIITRDKNYSVRFPLKRTSRKPSRISRRCIHTTLHPEPWQI